MVIKISTKTSDGRGIPVIVDDKPVGFIRDAVKESAASNA